MAKEKLTIIIDGDSTKAVKATKEVDTAVSKFTKNIDTAATKMKSAGLKMSLALTAPLVMIGKASIQTAMDVIESENLFEVSMENMADAAREWSEDLRESLGLNEYEIRKQVGMFNVMFASMGLGEQAAYDMAKGIVQLGYDMASFYNLEPEEAFDKLSSGMVGMSRPLQDMGILVNETTVKAWALSEGIISVGEELTETEKVMARYGTIMAATTKAQGDMARTLESPANQLRIFNEQVNMLKAELGMELLPMFSDVLAKLKPMVEWFGNLNDEQKNMVINIGLIATAAGPVLLILGNMVTIVKSLTTGIIALNVATKGALATATPLVAGYTALAAIAVSVAKGLNNVTLGFEKATQGARSWLSVLKELVQVITLYPPYYGEMLSKTFGGSKQSGGELRTSQYIPDLEIYGRKGEGIIPEPLMRAIKEGKPSYAGVGTGSGGSSITNNFNIAELVVREEADIHKISEELYDMQLTSKIGGGFK